MVCGIRSVRRLLIFSVALGLSLVAAVVLLDWRASRPGGDTVRLLDSAPELDELLARLRTDGTAPLINEGLVRQLIPEEEATLLFPMIRNKRNQYDSLMIFRRKGNQVSGLRWPEHPRGRWPIHYNSLGMREKEDPGVVHPDLRILVTGDSHTEGVVPTEESFTNVLEARLGSRHSGLTIEAWNAGAGAYDFYNYLGVIERYRTLSPDCFIVAVYGGNDFSGLMRLQRYFHGRGDRSKERFSNRAIREASEGGHGEVPQEIAQACYFLDNPEDIEIAISTAAKISFEIAEQCRASGTQLIFVYLPPPSRGQPQHFGDGSYADALEELGVMSDDLEISDVLADAWLALLSDREIEHVDMRETFGDADEPYYWRADLHLNTLGHHAVAVALARRVRLP